MVCIGQLVLIAGDLNAEPTVIPCLAKGISAGRYVDLALAYSLGAGLTPDVTCRFCGEEGTGSRRNFFVGCPNALAASHACYVTDRWFTPHFSVLARFRVGAWMADVACPVVCRPIWPACWLNTPDRSSSSSTRVVQDVWDVFRNELGLVPEEVVLALRDAVSRSSVDDFWSTWSRSAELGFCRAYSRATEAGSSAFLLRIVMFMAERAPGAAMRRWHLQLRAFHRHERLTVRMELAAALHHSAQPSGPEVEQPREVEAQDTHAAPRGQK